MAYSLDPVEFLRRGEEENAWDDTADWEKIIQSAGSDDDLTPTQSGSYAKAYGSTFAGDRLMPLMQPPSKQGQALLAPMEMQNFADEVSMGGDTLKASAELEAARAYALAQRNASRRQARAATRGAIIGGVATIGAALI